MLKLADHPLSEFRSAVETGRHHWPAWAKGAAVGYIDYETYDRWTTWDGAPGGGKVTATIPVPFAGIAYVIDPAHRRRGYATAMIKAVTTMPEFTHVELFAAGVEPEKQPRSAACAMRASGH